MKWGQYQWMVCNKCLIIMDCIYFLCQSVAQTFSFYNSQIILKLYNAYYTHDDKSCDYMNMYLFTKFTVKVDILQNRKQKIFLKRRLLWFTCSTICCVRCIHTARFWTLIRIGSRMGVRIKQCVHSVTPHLLPLSLPKAIARYTQHYSLLSVQTDWVLICLCLSDGLDSVTLSDQHDTNSLQNPGHPV